MNETSGLTLACFCCSATVDDSLLFQWTGGQSSVLRVLTGNRTKSWVLDMVGIATVSGPAVFIVVFADAEHICMKEGFVLPAHNEISHCTK